MTQLPFGEPPAQRHSPTSVEAADHIAPTAGTLRAAVLNCLRLIGPSTDEEIQTALTMNPSTERPRRIELCNAGLVVDAGYTRPTRSGRNAIVWKAAT